MSVHEAIRVCDYPARATMLPHVHSEPSLNVVLRGGFCEQIGRQERNYARGHIAFCPAGIPHSQAFGSGGARQLILKLKDDWLEYLADCDVRLTDSPYLKSAHCAQIGDRLLYELTSEDAWTSFACDGLTLELVAAFGRGRTAETSKAPPWLLSAREILRANISRPIQLDDFARMTGRHPVHVCREFRRHFGMSIGGYVRRLRIAEAIRLIHSNRLKLSEIALECGFGSHAHFCREFKRQMGMTPSQFQANAGLR